MATLYDLENKADTLESGLLKSPTAYAPNTAPTSSDLGMAKQRASVSKQLETLRSKQLSNKWYGAQTDAPTDVVAPPDGLIMSGLKKLSMPLNAIAGTAQYALGQGTKSSLAENVNEAMKTGVTFGNILQKAGAPRPVQIGLGFALDVMFDPVNWATMGTAALIPRIGTGFVKGALGKGATELATSALESGAKTGLVKGAEEMGLSGALAGAKAGAVSNIAKKVSTAMKFVPFAEKNIPKWAETRAALNRTAAKSAGEFDRLTGTGVADRINTGIFGQATGALGAKVEDVITTGKLGDKAIPGLGFLGKEFKDSGVTWGEKVVDFFKYSPMTQTAITDMYNKVDMLARKDGFVLVSEKGVPHFMDLAELKSPTAQVEISAATGELLKKAVDDAKPVLDRISVPLRYTADDIAKKVPGAIEGNIKNEFLGKVGLLDNLDNAKSILTSAGEDYNLKHLIAAYKFTPVGKTGVVWYDEFIDKAKATTYRDISNYVKTKTGGIPTAAEIEQISTEEGEKAISIFNVISGGKSSITKAAEAIKPAEWHPFEKVLIGLENLTAAFKKAKVALNFASQPIAVMGNYVMGAMMGIPVHELEFTNSLIRARQLLGGKLGAKGIKDLLFNDINMMIDIADNNPTRFRILFGFDPSEIVGKITTEQKVKGMIPTLFGDAADLIKNELNSLQAMELEAKYVATGKASVVQPFLDEGTTIETEASRMGKKLLNEKMGEYPVPSETIGKVLDREGKISAAQAGGSFTTEELQNQVIFDKIGNSLKEKLKESPNNPVYIVADKLFNALPRSYEHIDQSFKIATTDYLSRVGVTEQNLRIMSRTIPFDFEKDILKTFGERDGQKLYRLTPLKAGEVAMEAFMNYSAMPDFVKVMRALPVLGSNFYSFQYAMAIKAGKTAINNPAIFNKVSFLLSEVSGSRSPEEKKAMESQYNQYLNSPTVVKIMGMMNTDVKNIIPYYTMNMFNPSEKTYDNSTQGQLLKMSDQLPLFQNPVGQVIKDYFIQPWMLAGTGAIPQGQFGQPLYPAFDENTAKPIDVGMGTKAFYAGRTLAEAVVPGSLSYAGYPLGLTGISPEATNLIPSYGMRSSTNAIQGRNSLGAMTKEEVIRKTFKNLMSRSGIPIYDLDTTKINNK